MGLETTYIYYLREWGKQLPAPSGALDLPAGNTVVACLVIGYPKIKYLRTVDRKPMRVRWE